MWLTTNGRNVVEMPSVNVSAVYVSRVEVTWLTGPFVNCDVISVNVYATLEAMTVPTCGPGLMQMSSEGLRHRLKCAFEKSSRVMRMFMKVSVTIFKRIM